MVSLSSTFAFMGGDATAMPGCAAQADEFSPTEARDALASLGEDRGFMLANTADVSA